jgi:hypothetical protein
MIDTTFRGKQSNARDVVAHKIAAYQNGIFSYDETPPGLFVVSFLYLLLPTVAVLFRFQSWSFAAPVFVASIAAVVWLMRCLRGPCARPFWPSWRSWPFLLLAALAVWISGVLPPFAQNSDWFKHYALFNLMVDQQWPPAVMTEQGIGTLRYSLSYYVVPSIVAKFGGMNLLGPSIFAWTTLGLYLALMLALGAKNLPTSSRFILAAVFLFFSGADIIGTGFTHAPPAVPLHFEWWASFGQFSSNITSIIWTPQHMLAGWIATFLLLRYPERSVQASGVLAAAVAVWSPFCVIGIIPVFAWVLYRVGWRHLLTWMNLLIAPVLLIAGVAFLTNGSAGIPSTFIWNHPGFVASVWGLFLFLEFGAIALSLLLLRPRDAGLIGVASLSLLLLALTNVGAYNDLMMRGSLPALSILAVLSSISIVHAPNTLRKVPLIICLVFGLITPFGEIMRGFTAPHYSNTSQFLLKQVILDPTPALAPQYIVPGYSGPLTRIPIASLADTKLAEYGKADFDLSRHRITSAEPGDAAYVTVPLTLAPGVYEIELVADWDLTASAGVDHAAHVSLHGQRMIIPLTIALPKNGVIPATRYVGKDRHVVGYFSSKGETSPISFGIGGWALAKGYIEFKQFRISRVELK